MSVLLKLYSYGVSIKMILNINSADEIQSFCDGNLMLNYVSLLLVKMDLNLTKRNQTKYFLIIYLRNLISFQK